MSTTCARCGAALAEGQAICEACGRVVTGPHATSERRPVQQRRALMTELATQAMDLSDTFNIIFEGRFVGLVIDLAKPGMSTAGGKQAVQHIALHAEGGGSLVIGSVDTKTKRAELRSYDRLISMHRQRFGTELSIAEADWMSFLDRAEKFLREEGLAVTREAETVGGSPADFGERESRVVKTVPIWLAIVISAALILLAIVVTLALRPSAPPVPVPVPVPGYSPTPPPG